MLYIFEVTLQDHQMEQQEEMNVKTYQLIEQLVDHARLILMRISRITCIHTLNDILEL
jgi:hypothetical protein